jgi:hypothetical protein
MPAKPQYPITIAGKNLILQFDISDAPTKLGINMQFVSKEDFADERDKQDLANKLSVVLQKKFGDAGLAIDYNERNPYKNVISYIIPLSAISNLIMSTFKGVK